MAPEDPERDALPPKDRYVPTVPSPAPVPEPASEPPPPPGTDRTKFWESGAAKSAIVATVVLVNAILRPIAVKHLGDANAVLAEVAVWAWLAAVGIQRTDTSSLRWK